MAIEVTPSHLQKMEFDVTTTEGTGRLTIVTGMFDFTLYAYVTGQQGITQTSSFRALVDPTLAPGKFRKAAATASFGNISATNWGAPPSQTQWAIDDAQATYDDETGRTQLTVEATVSAFGNPTQALFQRIMFQVTTLALV